MEKKCKIIMLATQKADNVPILKNVNGRGDRLYLATKDYYYTQAYLKEQQFEANHLYITSDDEIKDGDWFIRLFDNTITLASSQSDHKAYNCKKIIATTDKSFLVNTEFKHLKDNLPQPSESFIQKYVESYNKGEKIEEVMVEYTNVWKDPKLNKLPDVLKINPKDNTITIRKIKDSYTREEHCTDMQYYMEYCQSNGYVTPMDWLDKYKHY